MPGNDIIVFATLGAVLVIFVFYLFFFFLDRSPYIAWWTVGWLLYLPVNFLSYLADHFHDHRVILLLCSGLFFLVNSMCNFIGTKLFVGQKPPLRLFYSLFAITALLFAEQIYRPSFSIHTIILGILVLVGIIRVWAGISLLKISQRGSLLYCLGWAYLLCSSNLGALSFLYLNGISRVIALFFFECIPLFIAVGFLMLYVKQTHENITQDKQQIKYFNIHDKLTGTFNRDYFEDVIKQLENNPEKFPISLIFCDINGLKLVNDTLGHKKGDQVLKKIAALLIDNSRKSDIVVRWGGDEFIVILPCASKHQAYEITSRFREVLNSSPSEPVPLSMAIGVATLSEDSNRMDDVFRKAEENMYANKLKEGNNNKLAIINALGQLLFNKDYETKEHVDRLEDLVRKMGTRLKLSESSINLYCLAAKLHDIGKITIPERILKKQGPLDSGEWEYMKKHAEAGYRLALSANEFASIAETILYHHEHWDGSGYPQGLSGEDILLSSRIIAIVDAYDVMIHDRPYKKAMNKADAVKELYRCSGTQFDPNLVDAFVQII
ncbi:MAG: diguanylate cyclase [Peptococcaceae bacterium]|nr:diguanylate cyclase [Peptococcaceae bacterium]